MIFVAALIRLKRLNHQRRLSMTDSIKAHAAVVTAISAVDTEAGRQLHDMRRHKHMTLAIIESTPQQAGLRVTFMDKQGLTCADALVNALSVYPMLRLGSTSWAVESVDVTDSQWAGLATWSDLTATENPGHHIRFQFVTPTAITKQDGDGGRFVSLYPDPTSLFSGLARRWQGLGGPALPDDLERFIEAGGCVVSNHSLYTTTFSTAERTQIGFVGHTVYECRKSDRTYTNALHALSRFARFTGVGYQTGRGMGAVQVSVG